MTILICWRLPQVEIMPREYLDLLNPNTRCYGKTFLVGSASLDPTLVLAMRRKRPAPVGGVDGRICSLGYNANIMEVRWP